MKAFIKHSNVGAYYGIAQVHGVDVEGMQLGIDEELVALLGRWSPVPVTYAGGARTLVPLRPPRPHPSTSTLT